MPTGTPLQRTLSRAHCRHSPLIRVHMQLDPKHERKYEAWDKEETAQFLRVLSKAFLSNKAKEVYVGGYRERKPVQKTLILSYVDAVFDPRARLALKKKLFAIPSLMLAPRSSAGSAATVGACMRVNVANYQAMNVQDKKLAWEELNFISDLSMVVLGAVILGLLAGDVIQFYHEYQAALPDIQFAQEFAEELRA